MGPMPSDCPEFLEKMSRAERKSLRIAWEKKDSLEALGHNFSDVQVGLIQEYFTRQTQAEVPVDCELEDSDEVNDSERFYEFAFGFLRDVVYAQMLHSQRKQLHMQCKQHYTKKRTTDYSRDAKWAI